MIGIIWYSLLIFFCARDCSGNLESIPTVNTTLGVYHGALLTSRLGKTIYAFRGIRYAQAPKNNLRFKPPVPVKAHIGIYDATKDGPVCPQPTDFPISEDCLLLNVYSTELPVQKTNVKRPVIIYLHAGGFYSGSGRSDVQGPQYLLDQDVVLVTISYRLATLGFLSLGVPEAPGNNGLKDQVMAMKWVQTNIYAFGGDPNQVTLAGYSAGSASVSCHLVSPMSKGLFHKAIMGSGSSLGNWPVPHNQYELAKKQAKLFGCPRYNSTEYIMECLKNATAAQYANSLEQFAEFNNDPIIIWGPVIETNFGQERFLTEHPFKSVWMGNFQKMPIMTGITTKEFAYEAIDVVKQPALLEKLNKEWYTYAPIICLYERYTNFSRNVSENLRNYYFGDKCINNNTRIHLEQLYADSVIGFGVNRGAEILSNKNEFPVYYYEFSFQGRYSHYYFPWSNDTVPYGVVHHDELIYVFYISVLFPEFTNKDPESKMVEKWTSVWANFARTGNPTPENLRGTKWERFDSNNKKYLQAGNKFVMKEGLYEERYQTWRSLFPVEYYIY